MNWDIDGPHFEQGEPVYVAEIRGGPHDGVRVPIPAPTDEVFLVQETRVDADLGGRFRETMPGTLTRHRYRLVSVERHGAARVGTFEHDQPVPTRQLAGMAQFPGWLIDDQLANGSQQALDLITGQITAAQAGIEAALPEGWTYLEPIDWVVVREIPELGDAYAVRAEVLVGPEVDG